MKKLSFKDVNEEEIKDDFYHPNSAQVLAYIDGELVGWAGIHEIVTAFEDKQIKMGGYGVCIHPDWQGKGIGSKITEEAMKFLRDRGCEVAFLSVDPSDIHSVKLHQKNGFVMLPRKFSWTNSKGELREDDGGMIAPVNSQELFEYILNGKDVLHVGNGYW